MQPPIAPYHEAWCGGDRRASAERRSKGLDSEVVKISICSAANVVFAEDVPIEGHGIHALAEVVALGEALTNYLGSERTLLRGEA